MTDSFIANDYKGYDHFLVNRAEDGVIHVQINRPRQLNAFSEKTWKQYHEIFFKLNQTSDVKVILLSSSNDRAFCAGLDLREAVTSMKSMINKPKEERKEKLYKHIKSFQKCIAITSEISVPTVALVNGISYGLALDIISACTIRVATTDAKFSVKEIDIGIPADIGSLQRLPKIINNQSIMNELALTGSVFSSVDALNYGLISRIVSNREEGVKKCLEICSVISKKELWAIKGTKNCIQFINSGGSIEEGLEKVAQYNSDNIDEKFVKSIKRIFKI